MKLRDMLGLLVCGTLLASTAFGGRGQAADGATVHAKSFSAAPHAGTKSDPWPGSAITRAINSLPQSGGTVIVDDGIWLFDRNQVVSRGNFVLQGSSLNAELLITTGSLEIGPVADAGPAISGVTLSTLTVDQSSAPPNSSTQGVQLWACNGCELSDSVLYGHANNSVSVFITFGGSDGRILRNTFTSRKTGGSQLQINALYNTSNSGFLVANNNLDSVNMLLIGMGNIHVTNNTITNQTLANFIGILFASRNVPTSGLLFDYNTIDATTDPGQGAVISGLPEDPGQAGAISNITIDHNTLSGSPVIAATCYEPDCVAASPDETQTYNIRITNNSLTSSGGSIIDVSGGDSGLVNGAIVDGNVFSPAPNNAITQDNHSYNVSVGNNSL
jgi:hypothetical protein